MGNAMKLDPRILLSFALGVGAPLLAASDSMASGPAVASAEAPAATPKDSSVGNDPAPPAPTRPQITRDPCPPCGMG